MKGSEYELDNRHFHSKTSRIQTGHSWILLSLAVVLHVIDEATHNFLAVYNPTVMALRERVPRLPLPVFSFRMWITSLAIAVALGFSLSLFLLSGALWVRPIVCVLSVLMITNGLNHTVGTMLGRTVTSVHFPRPMPGFYSSPALMAASIYVLLQLRNTKRQSVQS